MSDNESTKSNSPVKTDKKALVFTEKEELVLKAAWRCLKSGPPEVDIEKLTKAAGFNTQKTCSNMWGVLKRKLFSDNDGNPLPIAPATPKATKGKKANAAAASAKKRTKKVADDDEDNDDDEGRSIIKKTKPSPVKKRAIKPEDSDDE